MPPAFDASALPPRAPSGGARGKEREAESIITIITALSRATGLACTQMDALRGTFLKQAGSGC